MDAVLLDYGSTDACLLIERPNFSPFRNSSDILEVEWVDSEDRLVGTLEISECERAVRRPAQTNQLTDP
jgi:hypothetical protein